MDFEVAIKFINANISRQLDRSLSPLEKTILRGSWEGKTYEQIAESSEYSFNYLMRDVGPKFWRLLSKIFDENVNKNNIQAVISKLNKESIYLDEPKPHITLKSGNKELSTDSASAIKDWENAPAKINSFWKYSTKLNNLKQSILKDKIQLINIWGLAGMGKTTFMKELADSLQDNFAIVCWRSLASAPKFADFVASLAELLDFKPEPGAKNLAFQLLTKLRSHSCLLLLDSVEGILRPGQQAGSYLPGYEDYAEFLQLAGESFHQSCVITNSSEKIGGIFQFTGANSPIKSLKLSGLDFSAAESILNSKQITSQSSSQKLWQFYQGNPAMLCIASRIVGELFNDNLEEFLNQSSLVFGDIDRLLNRTFTRLSTLETELLYWLAGEEFPVSLAEIQAKIPLSIYGVELLEAIESLNQRCFLESKESSSSSAFTLSPMIREFAINKFIANMRGDLCLQDRHQVRLNTFCQKINTSSAPEHNTQLRNWLKHKFDRQWQPIDILLTKSNQPSFRMRSAFYFRDRATIKRFKSINLSTPQPQTVLLLVAISPENLTDQQEQIYKIIVQIQPEIDCQALPQNLQISLLDEADNVVLYSVTGKRDNFIQLPYFYGESAEKFAIKLNLQSASHQEKFEI